MFQPMVFKIGSTECYAVITVEQFVPNYLAFPYLQAMTLYQCLFDWVVKQLVNSSAEMEDCRADSIAFVIIHSIEILHINRWG